MIARCDKSDAGLINIVFFLLFTLFHHETFLSCHTDMDVVQTILQNKTTFQRMSLSQMVSLQLTEEHKKLSCDDFILLELLICVGNYFKKKNKSLNDQTSEILKIKIIIQGKGVWFHSD